MKAALRVQDLNKVYQSGRSRAAVHAVQDVSFCVEPGEVIGLLGPNGSGKTTTIKCICQLVLPSSGRVYVHGIEASKQPLAVLHHLAVTLEGSRNVEMRLTVRENLELFAALQGISRREVRRELSALLEVFRLTGQRDFVAQTLSRGMVQRLSLACCLIKRASILLLDEPTLGLDLQSAHELRALIKQLAAEKGTTVVLSSHDMDTVSEVCSRVVVMRQARVIADAAIGALVDRFRVQEYEINLLGETLSVVEQQLREQGSRLERNGEANRCVVRVSRESEALYGVLDTVRATSLVVESIVSHKPSLEQVLTQLLRGS